VDQWLKANGGPLAIVVVGLALIGLSPYLGGPIAAFGAALFVVTHPRLHRHYRVLPEWDDAKVRDALREAAPGSHIRILETWLPHHETLARLLIDKDKDFVLQVLLMNPGPREPDGDLLGARMQHRTEDFDRAGARRHVLDTIETLLNKKKAVEDQSDRVVNLKIRVYTFLPFGPLYDIGGRLFVGLYPAHCASEYGPMLLIEERASDLWSLFDTHFKAGWGGAREVVECDAGAGTFALR
jgi:hypothetical protein